MLNETKRSSIHFFDSGAFTLCAKAKKHVKKHGGTIAEYFVKPNGRFRKWFLEYMDRYAAFVKDHQIGIDFYANVDVIYHPELTWKSQQYLEQEHGLHPVPVIHAKTDPSVWLKHYIDKGYGYIGLGGGPRAGPWLERCFLIACNTPQRTPCVRLHGFGLTDLSNIIRFPWASVDSATWAKAGAFGEVIVPRKRKGRFVFDQPPYRIGISSQPSARRKRRGQHFLNVTPMERTILMEWFVHIGADMDSEMSLLLHQRERQLANIRFFQELEKNMPKYPWPFRARKGMFA